MNINLITNIARPLDEIKDSLGEQLFRLLTPEKLHLKVSRFDGIYENASFEIKLGYGPLQGKWVGRIIEVGESENEYYFVDVGESLPFPLKSWRHTHRFMKNLHGNSTDVIDQIEFTVQSSLFAPSTYAILLAFFLWRQQKIKSL